MRSTHSKKRTKNHEPAQGPNVLSVREQEVLCLIAQGKTSKEIGNKLGISSKTVEAHRANIKTKLKADSIAQLVQCAVVFGLIEPKCFHGNAA